MQLEPLTLLILLFFLIFIAAVLLLWFGLSLGVKPRTKTKPKQKTVSSAEWTKPESAHQAYFRSQVVKNDRQEIRAASSKRPSSPKGNPNPKPPPRQRPKPTAKNTEPFERFIHSKGDDLDF